MIRHFTKAGLLVVVGAVMLFGSPSTAAGVSIFLCQGGIPCPAEVFNSLGLQGLGANALPNIGAQPEPVEAFNVNVQALVFNPDKRCPEPVHLEGIAHLVTDVRQQKSGLAEITVFITLVGVHGEGAYTGARYLATGAVRKDVVTSSLPTSIPIQATFAFVPLGACRLPSPQEENLTVRFELAFDAAGNLASGLDVPTGLVFGPDGN